MSTGLQVDDNSPDGDADEIAELEIKLATLKDKKDKNTPKTLPHTSNVTTVPSISNTESVLNSGIVSLSAAQSNTQPSIPLNSDSQHALSITLLQDKLGTSTNLAVSIPTLAIESVSYDGVIHGVGVGVFNKPFIQSTIESVPRVENLRYSYQAGSNINPTQLAEGQVDITVRKFLNKPKHEAITYGWRVIDSNLPHFRIGIDPTSEAFFTQSAVPSEILDKVNNMGLRINGINSKVRGLGSLLSLVLITAKESLGAGMYALSTDGNALTDLERTPHELTGFNVPTKSFSIARTEDAPKPIEILRVNAGSSILLGVNATGNIIKDDYDIHPVNLNMVGKDLSNPWMSDMMREVIPDRVLGSHTGAFITKNSKLSEWFAMNSDSVAVHVKELTDQYTKSYKISSNKVSETIASTLVSPSDLGGSTSMLHTFMVRPVRSDPLTEYTSRDFFPDTDEARSLFKLSCVTSPASLERVFINVKDHIATSLSMFPGYEMNAIVDALIPPSSATKNVDVGRVKSELIRFSKVPNSEALALMLAAESMPHYVYLKVPSYDQAGQFTISPTEYLMQLWTLMLTKIFFYNTMRFNQIYWALKVDRFLSTYHSRAWNVVKSRDGIAQRNGQKITLDHDIHFNTHNFGDYTFTMDRGAQLNNNIDNVFGDVCALLTMTNPLTVVNATAVGAPYRINGRTFKIPTTAMGINAVQHFELRNYLDQAQLIKTRWANTTYISAQISTQKNTKQATAIFDAAIITRCIQFQRYMATIIAPIMLLAKRHPALWEDELEIQDLSLVDGADPLLNTISVKNPLTASLPGSFDRLFDDAGPLLFGVFLTSRIPGSDITGLDLPNVSEAADAYNRLTSPDRAIAMVDFYVKEYSIRYHSGILYSLASKITSGTLFDSTTRHIYEKLQANLDVMKQDVTNRSFILSVLGYDNTVDNVLRSKSPDPGSNLLPDLRITKPTLVYDKGEESVALMDKDDYDDLVPTYIKAVFNTFIRSIDAIRPVRTGYTISYLPIIGHVDYDTAHFIPSVEIQVAPPVYKFLDHAHETTQIYFPVQMIVQGVAQNPIQVEDPSVLNIYLSTFNTPAFLFRVNPTRSIDVSVLKFLYTLLISGKLVVYVMSDYYVQMIPPIHSSELSRVISSYITEDEFASIFTDTLNTLRIIKVTSTKYETSGMHMTHKVIPILPIQPYNPPVVLAGFNTPTRTDKAFVDVNAYPEPSVPTTSGIRSTLVAGENVPSYNAYPHSFINYQQVFKTTHINPICAEIKVHYH